MLELTYVAGGPGSCAGDTCPTVYASNRGTLVVQGYQLDRADLAVDVPGGEDIVEIPLELLKTAARQLDL